MMKDRNKWTMVGEHGPECTFPWPFDKMEDNRSDWQKIKDKHENMRRSTMAYKGRMRILLNYRGLKG